MTEGCNVLYACKFAKDRCDAYGKDLRGGREGGRWQRLEGREGEEIANRRME